MRRGKRENHVVRRLGVETVSTKSKLPVASGFYLHHVIYPALQDVIRVCELLLSILMVDQSIKYMTWPGYRPFRIIMIHSGVYLLLIYSVFTWVGVENCQKLIPSWLTGIFVESC